MNDYVYKMRPIGFVKSPYTQKFGIARQPGLVPAAKIYLNLNEDISKDCIRGLEEFEYIWVHFVFHDAIEEGWSPLVRPPRLGGKKKIGVFATRSPHRPNHLGLSLLKISSIEYNNKNISIICEGGDLLDNTPIIDIKPYIPFVESKPNAKSGFAKEAPPLLKIIWEDKDFYQNPNNCELISLIEQSIAQDPRPAYQNLPERDYFMNIANKIVTFRIKNQTAFILSVC